MSLGNGRDHSTLHRLWADLERAGGDYENGLITERDLLERHYLDAAKALGEYLERLPADAPEVTP